MLKGLWPLLGAVVLMELKTEAGPYQQGDLFSLFSLAEAYYAHYGQELRGTFELSVVLLVATATPSLTNDIAGHGWSLCPLGGGYARLDGCDFGGIVVFLDEVAKAESDDLIGCIAHRKIKTVAGAEWLVHRGGVPERLAMAKIAGFSKALTGRLMADKKIRKELLSTIPRKELLSTIPRKELLSTIPRKELLATIPVKDRVAGLPAKDRVAGLSPKELARVFRTLPLATRRKLAQQTGRPPA